MSELTMRLPDVGEGLTEAEVLTWHVAAGDAVDLNQVVVEIETAKSVVELPSPYAGTVGELAVAAGVTVAVGEVLLTILDEQDSASPADLVSTETPRPVEGEMRNAEEKVEVLVGYGPTADGPRRRRRRTVVPQQNGALDDEPAAPEGRVRRLAKPPVRKLAKDLGVDLGEVEPAENGVTVTRADLQRHVAKVSETSVPVPSTAGPVVAEVADPREERIAIRGIRKATADAMVESAFTAPHVTEFLTIDVTKTVDLIARLRDDDRFAQLRVTPLLIAARAVCSAAQQFPQINARWDGTAGEIVVQPQVNLGIAVATDRGLIVPNIKDAQQMGLPRLARALSELVDTARQGKATVADMRDGTITITNVGVFGVDAATPILNPGESAILCLGALRRAPWVVDDTVVPRWTMQLSLSFDHRLVDGELGSKVLTSIGTTLGDPLLELALS